MNWSSHHALATTLPKRTHSSWSWQSQVNCVEDPQPPPQRPKQLPYAYSIDVEWSGSKHCQ